MNKTYHDDLPESNMARGLKFAALAAVLGVIVVTAQAGPGILMSSAVVTDVPVATATSMPSAEYYPSHFAAPTTTAELPAQF